MDSGASVSVLSKDLCESMIDVGTNGSQIIGIGGVQIAHKPILCSFNIGSAHFYERMLKPIIIPGKSSTVI